MNTGTLPLGCIVAHVTKPEWGLGKIVKIEGDLVHVVWRDRSGLDPVRTDSKSLRDLEGRGGETLD